MSQKLVKVKEKKVKDRKGKQRGGYIKQIKAAARLYQSVNQ